MALTEPVFGTSVTRPSMQACPQCISALTPARNPGRALELSGRARTPAFTRARHARAGTPYARLRAWLHSPSRGCGVVGSPWLDSSLLDLQHGPHAQQARLVHQAGPTVDLSQHLPRRRWKVVLRLAHVAGAVLCRDYGAAGRLRRRAVEWRVCSPGSPAHASARWDLAPWRTCPGPWVAPGDPCKRPCPACTAAPKQTAPGTIAAPGAGVWGRRGRLQGVTAVRAGLDLAGPAGLCSAARVARR